jgi:hypothetical protein
MSRSILCIIIYFICIIIISLSISLKKKMRAHILKIHGSLNVILFADPFFFGLIVYGFFKKKKKVKSIKENPKEIILPLL